MSRIYRLSGNVAARPELSNRRRLARVPRNQEETQMLYHAHVLEVVDNHADMIDKHGDDIKEIDSALEDYGDGLRFHWDAIRALPAKVEALAAKVEALSGRNQSEE
jgi:hypothetical protein